MNISFFDLPEVFGEIVLFSRRNKLFLQNIGKFLHFSTKKSELLFTFCKYLPLFIHNSLYAEFRKQETGNRNQETGKITISFYFLTSNT